VGRCVEAKSTLKKSVGCQWHRDFFLLDRFFFSFFNFLARLTGRGSGTAFYNTPAPHEPHEIMRQATHARDTCFCRPLGSATILFTIDLLQLRSAV